MGFVDRRSASVLASAVMRCKLEGDKCCGRRAVSREVSPEARLFGFLARVPPSGLTSTSMLHEPGCGCGTFSRDQGFSFLSFSLPLPLLLLFCCAVHRRLLFCADTAEILLERCSMFVLVFSVQLQHDGISSCPDSLFLQLFTIDSVVMATQEGSRSNFQRT